MSEECDEVLSKLWDVIHYIESISSIIGERRAAYLELTLCSVEKELECCFVEFDVEETGDE